MRYLSKILGLTVLLASINVMAQADTTEAEPVYTQDKTAITVKHAHPQFTIKLKSNPTTGYAWFLREYDPSMVEPLQHSFEAPENKKMMGASGYEIWTFKMKPAAFKVPQQTVVRLVYTRAWETMDQSTQVVFRVSTIQ